MNEKKQVKNERERGSESNEVSCCCRHCRSAERREREKQRMKCEVKKSERACVKKKRVKCVINEEMKGLNGNAG